MKEQRSSTQIAQFFRSNRRKRNWRKVVTSMAAVVVFCVTYALILPANAVHRDTGGFYVYRVTPEGRERLTVARGIFTDALVQITQGLEEGEQVYVGN